VGTRFRAQLAPGITIYGMIMLIEWFVGSVSTQHVPVHTHGLPAYASQPHLPDALDGEV
jgi:hypothetical protein